MLTTKNLNIHRYLKLSEETMLKQINLKMPENLFKAAEKHSVKFGYKNIQEFALHSMRDRIFQEDIEYDDSFTEKEIELIEKIVEKSLQENSFVSEEELMKTLKK